jgi:hypothetical protein
LMVLARPGGRKNRQLAKPANDQAAAQQLRRDTRAENQPGEKSPRGKSDRH